MPGRQEGRTLPALAGKEERDGEAGGPMFCILALLPFAGRLVLHAFIYLLVK